MSLHSNASMLNALTRDIWSRWVQTREKWNDERGREFEQRYMDELMAGVNRTLTQIQELEKTLAKIRNDCE